MLATLSIVKRSTDWAVAALAGSARTASTRAGRPGRNTPSCLSRPSCPARPLHVRSNDHITGHGDDTGERAGERADNLGVELGAGAAPQFLQRLDRGPGTAV